MPLLNLAKMRDFKINANYRKNYISRKDNFLHTAHADGFILHIFCTNYRENKYFRKNRQTFCDIVTHYCHKNGPFVSQWWQLFPFLEKPQVKVKIGLLLRFFVVFLCILDQYPRWPFQKNRKCQKASFCFNAGNTKAFLISASHFRAIKM